MTVTEMVRKAHSNSVEKGFWAHYTLIRKVLEEHAPDLVETFDLIFKNSRLMLMVTELAEASESLRQDDKSYKMDHFTEELADVLIRVSDEAGQWGLPLERAVQDKMDINSRRAKLHGKSF